MHPCPGAFSVRVCEFGLLRLEQRRRPARQGHQAHHRRRQQGIRPRRGKFVYPFTTWMKSDLETLRARACTATSPLATTVNLQENV